MWESSDCALKSSSVTFLQFAPLALLSPLSFVLTVPTHCGSSYGGFNIMETPLSTEIYIGVVLSLLLVAVFNKWWQRWHFIYPAIDISINSAIFITINAVLEWVCRQAARLHWKGYSNRSIDEKGGGHSESRLLDGWQIAWHAPHIISGSIGVKKVREQVVPCYA